MIRKLHVQNFKSIKDVSVEFGPLSALVGPNMSGKSNLIDVFRFLFRMVGPAPGTYGLPNALLSLGNGFGEVAWKGGDSNLISISLEGDNWPSVPPKEGATWGYRIEIVGDRYGRVLVQDESLTLSTAEGEIKLIDNSGGQRKFSNSIGITLGDVGSPDRSALEFERTDWKGNALRDYILKWRFYSLVPSSMKSQNQSVAVSFLQEHGENFSSWLMTLQTRHDEFERIARVARDVFPGLERLFTQPTQQATVLAATREKHLKRTVSLNQMSDGELVFIALLSLIYSPPELAPTFLFIEEPENYLHVRLLVTLVELLKQVQQELSHQRCPQVIMTTHSPHLVDQFTLDELIVLEKREGATTITRPGDKEHLRKLLEEEEIGLGSLYYSGALGGSS